MFNSLFSKLNSNASEFVGVSLSPSGLLEVAQISRADKEVTKYTNRFVNYNAITREVESYENLKVELESALEELHLSPKNCNLTISMPNVLFGITDLPGIIEGAQVTEALSAEVQESYIFKRVDPIISWVKINEIGDMQRLAYSAIQETTIHELKNICSELGATLISVQNSFSTMFGGLSFSEKLASIVPPNDEAWNVLLITATSYSIFNFVGDTLNKYYEEPLAVKSFANEEVYTAVSSMAASTLQNIQGSRLLVISETDEVSAEVIVTKISEILPNIEINNAFYQEQNKFQQKPIINANFNVLPNYLPQISISIIGATVDYCENNTIKFNYLASEGGSKLSDAPDLLTIGDKTYELTPAKVQKLVGIICAILLVVFGGLYFLLTTSTNKVKNEINTLTEEENRLQTELQATNDKPVEVNISTTINTIVKENRKKMLYYDALSYGIPEKLWIEYFYAGTGGAVGINGAAVDSNDITAFLKGIREVSGESEVSVTKLTVIGNENLLDSDEQEIYSFELANHAYKTGGAPVVQQTQQTNVPGSNIPPANMPTEVPPVIPAN